MKNLFLLLTVLSLAIFTSCEKEDATPDVETGITLQDLDGTWITQEAEFEGVTYVFTGENDCASVPSTIENAPKGGYGYINIKMVFQYFDVTKDSSLKLNGCNKNSLTLYTKIEGDKLHDPQVENLYWIIDHENSTDEVLYLTGYYISYVSTIPKTPVKYTMVRQ